MIQTGLQESESGCKSVLNGGPGVGSDTSAGGGVGVDGGGDCWDGRAMVLVVLVSMVVVSVRRAVLFLPCEATSFPPSHSLLCHRLQTPGDIL